MKCDLVRIAALVMTCSIIVRAQTPAAPKPGPEHKKLEAYVGNWSFTGDAKTNVIGPAGKVNGTWTIQWMSGGFFTEMRYAVKAPAGDINGILIMGYDPARKNYTLTEFANNGMRFSGTLTNSGNTWNWNGSGVTADAKTMSFRCTDVFNGASSFDRKCEDSTDGKTWSAGFQGKWIKTK